MFTHFQLTIIKSLPINSYLHFPQSLGTRRRSCCLSCCGSQEDIGLLLVVITSKEFFLLCMKQPDNIPLKQMTNLNCCYVLATPKATVIIKKHLTPLRTFSLSSSYARKREIFQLVLQLTALTLKSIRKTNEEQMRNRNSVISVLLPLLASNTYTCNIFYKSSVQAPLADK